MVKGMEEHDAFRKIWDGQTAKYASRSYALRDFTLPTDHLPQSSHRVLDAGCGAGNSLAMYRQITPNVFGFDFSYAMTIAAHSFGSVVQSDVQHIPFASETFDYVSSLLVINHVPDSRTALAELSRVTRIGGRVIVLVPNRYSFLMPLRTFAIRWGKYSLGMCHHYSIGILREQGDQNGLVLVNSQAVSKPPTAINMWRSIPTWVGYALDQLVHRGVFWWGGDLAVMFEKRRSTN